MSQPTQTRRSRRQENVGNEVDDLIAYAREWATDDPDDALREELVPIIDAAAAGDLIALDDLRDRFRGLLEFGTAGLRGRLGAGPNRMNSAVVIRAAAGLVAHLQKTIPAPKVVIAFDARLGSAQFTEDTAAVVVGAGGRALVLPRPLPTPVLAFAIRHLGCDAGVMVTASHNPAEDNGYKVYLGDGSQIIPPVDGEIRRHIEQVRCVADVPRANQGWEVMGPEVAEAYIDAVSALIPEDGPRDVRILQTSMHGVGGATVKAVLAKAGFETLDVVAEQDEPDPTFPTVPFPNPEEPGAMDMVLARARLIHPDIVLAHDPDADRCAVAIPDPLLSTETDPQGWRPLRGDELGSLLAWDLAQRGVDANDVFARSIVSSRQLDAIAESAGCRHTQTLTGFKWISRAEGLRFGYEEAIGYCVAPHIVRDKDGISTGLIVCELAARLKAEGRSVRDVLDEIALTTGYYATDAFSVRVSDLSLIGEVMNRLRKDRMTISEIGDVSVLRADDLAQPLDELPPTDGIRYLLSDNSRVIVRPSGTEPKLKIYLEAVVPVTDGKEGLPQAREEAERRLASLRQALEAMTAV